MITAAEKKKVERFLDSEKGQMAWFKAMGRILGEMNPGGAPTKAMRNAAIEFLYNAKSRFTGAAAEHSTDATGKLWEARAFQILKDEMKEASF